MLQTRFIIWANFSELLRDRKSSGIWNLKKILWVTPTGFKITYTGGRLGKSLKRTCLNTCVICTPFSPWTSVASRLVVA